MRRLALCAATAAAAMLMFAACGDDGDGGGNGQTVSLDQYLREFERLSNEADTRSEALDSAFDGINQDTPVDELKQIFINAFDSFEDISRDLRAGLEAMEPPDEVEDQHNEILDAFSDFEDGFQEGIDNVQDAETQEDVLTAAQEATELDDVVDASERLDEACLELQTLADDNSIDVDLECDGE